MALLWFFLQPYAATGIGTRVSSVAPPLRDLFQDALLTELSCLRLCGRLKKKEWKLCCFNWPLKL